MHFAAASRCALTKFSYSSFGVFFSVFLVVFRICFLILIRIYLLYLCCSIGPSHSVWWSLFVWRFFVGLTVFSPWLFGDTHTHISTYMCVRVCACMCTVTLLLMMVQIYLFFSFIWNNEKSLIWYIGIITSVFYCIHSWHIKFYLLYIMLILCKVTLFFGI